MNRTPADQPLHFPGFEHDGMWITNPTASDDGGRSTVSPEYYGFTIYYTSGCMAWRKDLPDGRYILLTNEDGSSHQLGEAPAPFLLSLHDVEGGEGQIGIWQMQVGVVPDEEEEARRDNDYEGT